MDTNTVIFGVTGIIALVAIVSLVLVLHGRVRGSVNKGDLAASIEIEKDTVD